MKKLLSLGLVLVLALALLAGCGANEEPAATEEPAAEETADVVTTASIVNENDAFLNAISADGTWIIATLSDLTFDQELVLEGDFHNKDDSAQDLYRKIAPYTQDEDHNVIDRFNITAPKLTIKSPNAKIQGGNFVGDVYVESNGFILKDAKIEGNLYFANEEAKSTFKLENEAEVTGVTEVMAADAVSAPSVVTDEASLINAMSKDGSWIPYLMNDVTTDKEIVLEGDFHKKNLAENDLYRKIALYAQDADHNITEKYTLTAPKLTVKSPNTTIQSGTFVGDIYVEANGFNLSKETTIEGNIYFANEEYKASFTNDESTVTGVTEVK